MKPHTRQTLPRRTANPLLGPKVLPRFASLPEACKRERAASPRGRGQRPLPYKGKITASLLDTGTVGLMS